MSGPRLYLHTDSLACNPFLQDKENLKDAIILVQKRINEISIKKWEKELHVYSLPQKVITFGIICSH